MMDEIASRAIGFIIIASVAIKKSKTDNNVDVWSSVEGVVLVYWFWFIIDHQFRIGNKYIVQSKW